MLVLGLSGRRECAAAALADGDELLAAVRQDAVSTVATIPPIPHDAIARCLAMADVEADDVELVAVAEKPMSVLSRKLATAQRRGPRGFWSTCSTAPGVIGRQLGLARLIEATLRDLGRTRRVDLRYVEQQAAHAAAGFFTSGFDAAAVVVVDHPAEWACTSVSHGAGRRLEVLAEQRYPDSLAAVVELLGIWSGAPPAEDAARFEKLAAAGDARFSAAVDEIVSVLDDGSVTVDPGLVDWFSTRALKSRRLAALLGGPPCSGPDELSRAADIARSARDLAVVSMTRMSEHALASTGAHDLVLAGGLAALPSVTAGVASHTSAQRVWVPPGAGNPSSAIGAALTLGREPTSRPTGPRQVRVGPRGEMFDDLGPSTPPDLVARSLSTSGLPIRRPPPSELATEVAAALAAGLTVAWFGGSVQLGPGPSINRCVLSDPRLRADAGAGSRLHRPAAIAVRVPDAESCCSLAPRLVTSWGRAVVTSATVPGCAGPDGSVTVVLVDGTRSPELDEVIEQFTELTGVPALELAEWPAPSADLARVDELLDVASGLGTDLLVIEGYVVDPKAPTRRSAPPHE